MEILIEFGKDIGVPYGRDQYTRMGHIGLLGYNGIDYGLNSNGAIWTASSTYLTLSPNYIGIINPSDGEFHHMNNSGYKWYKCENINCYTIKNIFFYSSTTYSVDGKAYYQDFPHNIKITCTIGTQSKIILDSLDMPTNYNQKSKIINIEFSSLKYLVKQQDKYYMIKDENLIELGIPTDNIQLEQWFNDYGVDDLNQLCTKYSTETIVSSGETLGDGKLFTFNILNNMENINNVN
ncbi:hypothetical protein ACFHWD_03150 [Clostridium sp. MT-14]|uniref:hypothetical protein n=1 Tax=Clostridium sp. MT-14 TaxID=3348360 RepID=UPI0035F2B64B